MSYENTKAEVATNTTAVTTALKSAYDAVES